MSYKVHQICIRCDFNRETILSLLAAEHS
uniref:Uncharacterized protein n=1 Tax=Medicago truncatula TaxID=3880 RepID=I3SSF3_MEDTR|nr:unknown [Medicago truncatula]